MPVTIDENIQNMISHHLSLIKTQIENRSLELASKETKETEETEKSAVMPRHAFQSINEYAPGRPITEEDPESKVTAFFRMLFTSTLGVSAILAVVFGIFGLVGFGGVEQGHPELVELVEQQRAAFIDIAKIFAGAVVGAAGANALTSHGRVASS
ncbi:hypothetical protein FKG94_10010 [Exilibacterium tricleocarpae]|uniref:Uncharacterized protein n=1 Tax=Exilibacterium tricleocarpae TaxID=2591008 RepID=A0A545TV38_9GAMM|nr:hypothetical protein [Exilibacterium tricleocarpae]TQV81021.1 hypothetical protein FKG94_10010 [Exilibacterium tricleocarpae]